MEDYSKECLVVPRIFIKIRLFEEEKNEKYFNGLFAVGGYYFVGDGIKR